MRDERRERVLAPAQLFAEEANELAATGRGHRAPRLERGVGAPDRGIDPGGVVRREPSGDRSVDRRTSDEIALRKGLGIETDGRELFLDVHGDLLPLSVAEFHGRRRLPARFALVSCFRGENRAQLGGGGGGAMRFRLRPRGILEARVVTEADDLDADRLLRGQGMRAVLARSSSDRRGRSRTGSPMLVHCGGDRLAVELDSASSVAVMSAQRTG